MNYEIIAAFNENDIILDTQKTRDSKFYYNENLLVEFDKDPYNALFEFSFEDKIKHISPSLLFVHKMIGYFIESSSKNPDIELSRTLTKPSLEDIDFIKSKLPFMIGMEFVNDEWILKIFEKINDIFTFKLKNYEKSVESFLTEKNSHMNVAGKIFFHLIENNSQTYPFAFVVTYSQKMPNGKIEHLPLQDLLLEKQGDVEFMLKLLLSFSMVCMESKLISEIVYKREIFYPLQFTKQDAYIFLKEVSLYEKFGIMCRLPNWWRKKTNSIKVKLSIGDEAPSYLGMQSILSFNPYIDIDGEVLTKQELEELVKKSQRLYLIRGKWVEVDHEKLNQALKAFELAMKSKDITLMEAMRMQMGISNYDIADDEESNNIEITNGQWIKETFERITNLEQSVNTKVGRDFKTSLRHYQQNGLDWLKTMQDLKFGALLADDMGLGKTIQVLALLEVFRKKKNFKTLLIVPASLLGNWSKEIEKFTPKLKYEIIHGKNNKIDLKKSDLFITTYKMISKLEEAYEINWNIIILDEAQAIKNPSTKQTRSIKKLKGENKIAMTGTPIENKLTDLYSIFDFLNPGLLGTSSEFSKYAKNLIKESSYEKLRKTISPFILRRLKTDKNIIKDLPDKIEIKKYINLSKKQVVLYKSLVNEIEYSLNHVEDGIKRKGIILASIVKFKQICNHPDQYLGQTAFSKEHSGKFALLEKICETIKEKREKVLIFTQFKEMCKPLSDFLEEVFEREGLVLHGGTNVKKRTLYVEQFNSDKYIPFMVLSLKAGGVGLNLTSANHVIHFDRWWNLAIENQATDRAFRIGQNKNVMVHKFITKGSIEEKIDLIIEDKLKLSNDLIQSNSEKWITQMNNKELMDLFKLEE